MNLTARIEIHRLALTRIVTTIAMMAGLIESGLGNGLSLLHRIAQADRTLPPRDETLSRRTRGVICRLLKPAESAARRLAIALAQRIVVTVIEKAHPLHLRRPLHRVPRSPSPVNGGGSASPPAGSGSSPAQRGRGTAERGGGGVVENGGSVETAGNTSDTETPSSSRPIYIALPAPASDLPTTCRTVRLGIANVAPPPARSQTIPSRLPIFDPAFRFRKRRATVPSHRGPRILFTDGPYRPLPKPQSPADLLPCGRLFGRIESLVHALDDLPAVARRYARWKARIDAENALAKSLDAAAMAGKLSESAAAQGSNFIAFRTALAAHAANPAAEIRFHRDLLARPRVAAKGRERYRRTYPLKLGHPPGCRVRKRREIDDILLEAHALAWQTLHRRE